MLNDVIYNVHIIYDNETVDDVVRRMCEAFCEGDYTYSSQTSIRSALSQLLYVCRYASVGELARLVSPVFGTGAACVKMTHLVTSNNAKKYSFTGNPEFSSRVAYCLTSEAAKTAGNFFHVQTSMPKVRRSRGKVPMHDFAVGVNMLHLLNSPFWFSWSYEETLSGTRKVRASLCMDALIFLEGKKEPYTVLFLEQDMSTESIGRLLEKIEVYDSHNLTLNKNFILLVSIYATSDTRRHLGCFDKVFLRKVMSDMDGRTDSLYQYCQMVRQDVTSYSRSYMDNLKRLVVALGIANAPGCNDIFYVDYRTPLETDKNFDEHDYGMDELCNLYDDIEAGEDSFVQKYENYEHWNAAFRRWRSAIDALTNFAFGSRVDGSLATTLIMGYRCFFAPTVLLSNYFPYMFPSSYGTYYRYLCSIVFYYNFNIEQDETGEYVFPDTEIVQSPALEPLMEDYPSFGFHNVIKTPDGGIVIIDHAWDIGAVFRAYILLNSTSMVEMPYKYMHFIFICDDKPQMDYLDKYFRWTNVSQDFALDTFAVYYLPADQIGFADRLFAGGSVRGRREVVPVHSKKYYEVFGGDRKQDK